MMAPRRRTSDKRRRPDIGWLLTIALVIACWALIAFALELLPIAFVLERLS